MIHVEPSLEMCHRCGKNPVRAHDQRYCKACHAEANREHRAREKKTKRQLIAEILDLRNQLEELKQQQNGTSTTPP